MPVPVVAVLIIIAAVVCVIFNLRAAGAEKARLEAAERSKDLEKRLTGTHEELNALRDDIKRKTQQLEEARDKVQKARRKADREDKALPAATVATPGVDKDQLARFAAAVESAERRAKQAEAKANEQLELVRAEARAEADKEINALKRSLAKRDDDDKARAAAREKEKAEDKNPNIAGVRLDLKALPQPAIDELARFMRRARNSEKLLAVADGERELLADKLEETQRRYFAVCRELALVAVNKDKPQDIADQEAANVAMDMVRASEEATRRRESLKRGPRRPETRSERPEGGAEAKDREPRRDRPQRERRPRGADAERGPRPDRGPRPEGAKPVSSQPVGNTPVEAKADVVAAAPEAKPADPAPAAPVSQS